VRTLTPVAGRVVDEAGVAIAGARVRAHSDRSAEGLDPFVGEGRSDGSGAFAFDVASSNPIDLYFLGDQNGKTYPRGAARHVRPGGEAIVLRPLRVATEVSLRVQVINESGPVDGADVYAIQGGYVFEHVCTDASGSATVQDLLDVPCYVEAWDVGSVQQGTRAVRVGPVEPDGRLVQIALDSGCSVSGTATALDGRPLERASIQLFSGNVGVGDLMTDAEGRFLGHVQVRIGTPLQLSAKWPAERPTHRGCVAEMRAGIDEPSVQLLEWTDATEVLVVRRGQVGVALTPQEPAGK